MDFIKSAMTLPPPFSPPLIAIDGPSASGKGTLARRLAAHYDFAYLDTGLLYRATGFLARRAAVPLDDAASLALFAETLTIDEVIGVFDLPALRSEESSSAASKVGAVPQIRTKLLAFQHDFIRTPPQGKAGAVLDGRDIGTVIAPEAPVKIFINADVTVRAERRWKELQARGEPATYAAVLEDLRARDARDINRPVAPTVPAADALVIDATALTVEEVVAAALAFAEKARVV